MPEIGEKFYRSTLVSPDVAPGNDGGGEEYMAKVKTRPTLCSPTNFEEKPESHPTTQSSVVWETLLKEGRFFPQEVFKFNYILL